LNSLSGSGCLEAYAAFLPACFELVYFPAVFASSACAYFTYWVLWSISCLILVLTAFRYARSCVRLWCSYCLSGLLTSCTIRCISMMFVIWSWVSYSQVFGSWWKCCGFDISSLFGPKIKWMSLNSSLKDSENKFQTEDLTFNFPMIPALSL
jgi:hypothetical protein